MLRTARGTGPSTIRNYTKLTAYKNNKCEKCKNKFMINNDMHTRINGKGILVHYHKSCWEKLLY